MQLPVAFTSVIINLIVDVDTSYRASVELQIDN
jgi:hypothetical protein